MCSTSSLLGTSWTHGLLPSYPKPCEPALREQYDCLRIVVHLTICKLAGIEGLFCARRSFYSIDLPSNPGTYNLSRHFSITDLDNFSKELVICRCVDCGLDDLCFQSLFGYAYNFAHVFHPSVTSKVETLKLINPGYVKALKNSIVAATASHGGHGPHVAMG
jgi:hypothetical protein